MAQQAMWFVGAQFFHQNISAKISFSVETFNTDANCQTGSRANKK
jgi:hypothetical protein